MAKDWHDTIFTSHAIIYRNCNFHCGFCNNDFRPKEPYKVYSHDGFVSVVCQLIPHGRYFKFTGGEPTINIHLERDLRIVKDLGGFVFLDTNGSMPDKVNQLIDNKLIDGVGISLKGLSQKQASEVSFVKESKFCWNNVWETIRICNDNTQIRSIVTYVISEQTTKDEILKFVDLITPFKNTTIKINNLMYEKHHTEDLSPIPEHELSSFVKELLVFRPAIRGRLIYIPNEKAITDYSKIIFY